MNDWSPAPILRWLFDSKEGAADRRLYAPTLERESDGRIVVLQWPPAMEPRE